MNHYRSTAKPNESYRKARRPTKREIRGILYAFGASDRYRYGESIYA